MPKLCYMQHRSFLHLTQKNNFQRNKSLPQVRHSCSVERWFGLLVCTEANSWQSLGSVRNVCWPFSVILGGVVVGWGQEMRHLNFGGERFRGYLQHPAIQKKWRNNSYRRYHWLKYFFLKKSIIIFFLFTVFFFF